MIANKSAKGRVPITNTAEHPYRARWYIVVTNNWPAQNRYKYPFSVFVFVGHERNSGMPVEDACLPRVNQFYASRRNVVIMIPTYGES